jgi:AcrR family transcriptional regulator
MSPRTPEQFEEIRGSRRQQIMNAGLELFARKGFNNCSISQLASHAGISKGLLYNYFKSKEALLSAIIEEGIANIMNMIDPNRDGVLEPGEVEGFIRNTFRSIRENLQFWVLFINVAMQPPVKEFLDGKPFSSVMEHFAPKLLDYFEKMGFEDPYLEMLSFSAMIEGYGIILVYFHPTEEFSLKTIKKFEDRMVDMFTRIPEKNNSK